MNQKTLAQLEPEVELKNLARLARTNEELLECGVISKKEYAKNRRILADRTVALFTKEIEAN